MKILGLIARSLSDLERLLEAILDPRSNVKKPEAALVQVRLIELLPPELPGWPSRPPTTRHP
jgi:hypothetical protein